MADFLLSLQEELMNPGKYLSFLPISLKMRKDEKGWERMRKDGKDEKGWKGWKGEWIVWHTVQYKAKTCEPVFPQR